MSKTARCSQGRSSPASAGPARARRLGPFARKAAGAAFLLLASLILPLAPSLAAPVFFNDDFNLLDPTVWAVSNNGYPAPAVDVSGGLVHMGRPGVSSLDFPYVRSQTALFPTSGDFSIAIGFQYTGIASKGDGLQVLDASNSALFAFWQDSTSGFLVGPGGAYSFANSLAPHEVEFRLVGATVTTLLDGAVLGSSALSARPASLWFGHPTIGQVINTQTSAIFPGLVKVDANGVVLDRWWSAGPWTTFNVDYIRVRALTAVPEPGALPLLGAGLVVLGLVRRGKRARGAVRA